MKSILTFLTILFITGLPAEAASPYNAIIRLSDEASVQAPLVKLGEIASIECDDRELEHRLINLILSKAPKISSNNTISAYTIKNILKKEGFEKIKLFGFQTEVKTRALTLHREELKEKIESWVQNELDSGTSTEISFKSLASRWSIPEGENVEIRIEKKGRRELKGHEYLTLRSLCDDQVFSSTHTRIHIALFQETAVVVKPLRKGEVLTQKHVKIQRTDVTDANGMETKSYQDLLGKIAKHDIKVGSLLSVNDFELPILIKRGTLNRIVIINGPVRMNVTGAEALQNGKAGEIVMFRNPMNKRENLHAKVMKEGVALMKLR
ncbi:hypothetical protein SCG7109_AB_00590 [Chlamydiales bacterium SCGC AG-110-M15]|nr:hypothetical protein SCG7109_AB_00590 [Chlamydiales bacterium SCGC AG-110-M15]